MNISEIDVFNGGSQVDPPENEENEDFNIEDIDCPMIAIFEKLYVDPKPYGITLSIDSTAEILEGLGYTIVKKDGQKYALTGQEKLSRSKTKREEQTVQAVYQKLAEELVVKKFIKDWNDVFGTTGDSKEA
jgi:hypothetical protein